MVNLYFSWDLSYFISYLSYIFYSLFCISNHQQSSDVEGSTEVTEAPEEDGLKISSNDNEFETEKLEIGDALSHEEEKPSVLVQNDDELDLKLPEEKIKVETLSNEEISQILEEVEEPSITHNKEEVSMLFSTSKFYALICS